ncbi:ParB/RepB/Spo0J family partition protein [Georgenia wangjunii]|uniref:ParB/RepB/Spo0J family partition protein n=1 Tax=Georgenia wangjunii TaxID=3117730 RepID=UPI002F264BE3
MTEKRRGLGKGLGALIPSAPVQGRPIDVFFADHEDAGTGAQDQREGAAPRGLSRDTSAASVRAMVDASTKAAAGKSRSGTRSSTSRSSRPTAPAPTTAGAEAASAAEPDAPLAQPDSPVAQREADDSVLEAPAARPTEAGEVHAGAVGAAVRPLVAADAAGVGEDASAASDAGPSPAARVEADTPDDGGLRAVPGASFAEIPIDDIVANRRQPRQVFDEEDLDELASSIREVGVLQPIVVRELPDGDDARFELIMGERRWRASRLAGNDTVPAIIRETGDTDLLRDALLENLHRAQLNPLEEAAAYSQLLEDFGCTHDELAARIARSRPQISNTLRLLKLPPLVQRRVAAGVLSAGHARALLGLSDGAAMERLAQRIVSEGLSVRTTEEIVALGDEPVQPEMRRRPRIGEHTAELNDLSGRLADRFDTRVKIALGQRKGRINIEFASMEDLNRILEMLAPDEPAVRARSEAS